MTKPDPRALLQSLAARDGLAHLLGIAFVDGGVGHATVELEVTGEHLNFNGTCHGGVIFSLADCAFGLASNSHGAVAAAINAHLSFNRAVREGDTITAEARERNRSQRVATYSVDVKRADGALVSVFTGTVYVSGKREGVEA